MSSSENQTIVIIGLSGAGLKTFNLLVNQLYNPCQRSKGSKPIPRLIVIEKTQYPYWPPGALRASVVSGFEEKVVRSYDHIIPKKVQDNYPDLIKIVTGREVVNLDLNKRLVFLNESLDEFGIEGGKQLSFNFLVIASGSSYPFPCRPPSDAKTPEALKTQLRALQEEIRQSQSIVIVGAGPVGIELAGEISSQYKDKSTTLICSSDTLLPEMNKSLANSLQQQLVDRHVQIKYGSRADLAQHQITKTGKLEKMTKIGLIPRDGAKNEEVEADFVFLAMGNKPNTQFIPSEYLNGESKLIRVDERLQVMNKEGEVVEGVYGVGDPIDFQESKLYASLDGQASTVSKNLLIDILGSKSDKVVHKPLKDTIAIPLGPFGGASEILGFTFGLGPLATSIAKGKTLLVWMFNSMYPDKSC